MSNSNLKRVTYVLFAKKLSNVYLRQRIASDLSTKLEHIADYRADEIMKALEITDKELFMKFRDGKITLNQYKARLSEKRGLSTYKVLEDIWPQIHPTIKEDLKKNPEIHHQIYGKHATASDLQRPLADWELNPHCLRSIKYHHKKGQKKKSHHDINVSMIDEILNNRANDSGMHSKKDKSVAIDHNAAPKENQLVDARSLITVKAREKKEQEILKYIQNIYTLKQKLAKAIIDKAVNVEDM